MTGTEEKVREEERVVSSPETAYVSLRRRGFRYGCYLAVKRIFDILSSLLVFILTSPLLLVCLLIKWLEDFHNPFYVSKRVGRDGKVFSFLKIRSMRPDADKLKAQMIAEGLNEADGPAFKMKNDPRITKFGRFLRRTSIDELPQLLNILAGQMSVVGPRPPLDFEVEQYTEEQRHRLDVKGGLLCLWQIQPNRHDVSFEDWVAYDIEYIKNQGFGLDVRILVKGFFMVFSGKSGD